MKKLICLLAVFVISAISLATFAEGTKSPANSDNTTEAAKPRRTYYYVVFSSSPTLAEAKQVADESPDLLASNIYKATANGRTVYRMAAGPYYSRSEAEDARNTFRDYFNCSEFWIWTTTTKPTCVAVYSLR